MEILTTYGLKEHVGLIHDDEMKKGKKNAMSVELNSTNNVVYGSTWSSMMNQVQKKEKFKCGQCNKIFTTRRNLDNHKIMHSYSRPHEGDICDEAVRRKDCIKPNTYRRKIH